MRVCVYPADQTGCGFHRLIWPALAARGLGHDVQVAPPSTDGIFGGQLAGHFATMVDGNGNVTSTTRPPGVDVVVFQRVCHRTVVGLIGALREKGVAVVVDVDDDLSSIPPGNPAFYGLHPKSENPLISWRFLHDACNAATLVTVSTPALLPRYAAHGRGIVLPNYLAEHYYEPVEREDSPDLGWPGSMWAHPNDPQVVGPAVGRLVREGARFTVVGDPVVGNPGRAFGLPGPAEGPGEHGFGIKLEEWPRSIERIGVGLVPLADTRFNAGKSWLKGLELAARGVPWVASPRTEYVRLHRLGVGRLAARPKDWYRELKRLREDPVMRRDATQAGLEVAGMLRLRDHAWEHWHAWEQALVLQLADRVASRVPTGGSPRS